MRPIEVRVDTSIDQPGLWRLVAECADEITSMTMLVPEGMASPIPVPTEADMKGPFGQALVQEHIERCAACRANEP